MVLVLVPQAVQRGMEVEYPSFHPGVELVVTSQTFQRK